ncbi:TIGR04222 domain-containing membrane protein [Embleya hyalina]|uniref:TIGR04222 domain-containing membrane protein n=1 Tax=Embleya hyalina TaxID=516124 RepID=UPI00135C767F|nr:TIGR04222 domain-containing membrane protein [Embleya hyalina]
MVTAVAWGVGVSIVIVLVSITIVLWAVGLVARRLVRGRTGAPVDVGELDAYDVAFLAGGYARVADTALAWLLDRRWIRVDRDGRVTPAKTVRPDAPAPRYVFDALGRAGATRHEVVTALRSSDSPAFDAQCRLIARGLVAPPGMRLAACVPGAVIFAVAPVAVGLVLTRVVEGVPALAAILLALVTYRIAYTLVTPVRETAAGRATRRALAADVSSHRAGRPVAATTTETASLMAVPCLGLAALPDSPARTVLLKSARQSIHARVMGFDASIDERGIRDEP